MAQNTEQSTGNNSDKAVEKHRKLHTVETFALTYLIMCAFTDNEFLKIGASSAASAAFYHWLAPWMIKQVDAFSGTDQKK